MPSLIRLVCLIGLLAWPLPAVAQEYPTKAIKFVVPFPAGGPADTFARVLGDKLATLLGQPVVIENRAGAGGLTGTASVAKADPDGHTIGIAASSALAINVNLREHMPFQPLKDFRLMTQIASVPEILVVGEAVPAKSLAELVALAKAQPGKLVFASTGLGGMPHLATELLKITAGIDLVHLPYTGAAPAVNDLLGGHVQLMFADVPVLLGAVQAGKLRALAIGSRVRSPSLPDVPTTAELGMPACRGRQLVRPGGAGRHAGRHRRQAARRRRRGPALGRGEGQVSEPGRDRRRQLHGGVHRLRQKRDRPLGQGHRRRRHQDQVRRAAT